MAQTMVYCLRMKIIPIDKANDWVRLAPIDTVYFDGIISAAQDESIWEHYPTKLFEKEKILAKLNQYLNDKDKGEFCAHVVIAPDNEVVGMTCYLNIRASDMGAEIGFTWYAPKFQGTKINPAAKFLMLENAFNCGAQRVEFKTDSLNLKSRAALLKLGARFEGIFRKHMLRENGTWRDSAYYSIIADEWPQIRENLFKRLSE